VLYTAELRRRPDGRIVASAAASSMLLDAAVRPIKARASRESENALAITVGAARGADCGHAR